jgi:hypothetical protein
LLFPPACCHLVMEGAHTVGSEVHSACYVCAHALLLLLRLQQLQAVANA